MMRLEHRILITGGAGFIGSHLAEKLVADGEDVICIDNFFSGSRRNVEHLLDRENFELRRHDICRPLNLEVHEIYNFASVWSAVPPVETPQTISQETTETTIHGAANLLALARQRDCKLFQASGSAVYDDPVAAPAKPASRGQSRERYLPSYGAGLRFAETLFFDHSRRYGLDFKIGRIFTTFGPRMPLADGSVAALIVKALQGKKLELAGDGSRLQPLIYVDDVVKSCVRLMHRPKAITGPIDIASEIRIPLAELAERIIALTGSKSEIVLLESAAEPPAHRPDLVPGRETLGWSPATPLDTGLNRTIEYFDALLRAGSLSLQS